MKTKAKITKKIWCSLVKEYGCPPAEGNIDWCTWWDEKRKVCVYDEVNEEAEQAEKAEKALSCIEEKNE